MFSDTQQHHRVKEPAVLSAERLMESILSKDIQSTYHLMDPRVVMTTPMGIFASRPQVKAWLHFEVTSVIKEHKITFKGTSTEDGLKVARNVWSIGELTFTDTVTLNQVLVIRSIKRKVERKPQGKPTLKKLTDDLLLAWTGPYFSRFCAPRKGAIDNRALVLPVLDYTYMGIKNVRELLYTRPRQGKEITDSTIALHFMRKISQKDKDELAEVSVSAPIDPLDFKRDKEEIAIRAKGRDGEQAAILIDKTMLSNEMKESRVESLEDGEVVVKEDRLRYVCSGIKLNNNELTNATELEQVLRIYVLNAFYFLTWIDLSSNQLTSIPDLSQYPILVLYLHDNKISNIKEVEKLQGLSQLQTLTLFGNPIQCDLDNVRDYKYKVLSMFLRTPQGDPVCSSVARSRRRSPARSRSGSPGKRPGSAAPNQCAAISLRSFDHSVLTPLDKQNLFQYATVLDGHDLPRSRVQTPAVK